MTTEEMIAVMQHFANGGKVEVAERNGSWDWNEVKNPLWNWSEFRYRIKSEDKEIVLPEGV